MNIELDKIILWEQYKKNDFIKSYFIAFRDYLQHKYVSLFYHRDEEGNIVVGDLLKDIGINDAVSEFVEFYIENIYGLIKPQFVSRIFYDSGYNYDSGYKYDSTGELGDVPIVIFIKLFKFIYNLNCNYYSIPILSRLIANFCDISSNEIIFIKDTTLLKHYKISLPTTIMTTLFKNLYEGYTNMFNFPIGVTISITLI